MTWAGNSVGNTGMFSLLLSSAFRAKVFLLLASPCQEVSWGCTRIWEGIQSGQLKNSQGYPRPWCRDQPTELGRRKGEMLEVMLFVSPSHHYTSWSPAVLRMAEHLPSHGKWCMNSLVCFPGTQGFCFTC